MLITENMGRLEHNLPRALARFFNRNPAIAILETEIHNRDIVISQYRNIATAMNLIWQIAGCAHARFVNPELILINL